MKKLMLMLSLLFVFLASSCKPEEKLELAVSEVTIECGDVLSLNAEDYLVDGTDKEILDNVIVDVGIVNDEGKTEGPIDTDGSDLKVGSYQLSLRYNIEIKLLTVIVQDTTPPEFIDCPETVTFVQGIVTDLTQVYDAKDFSDFEVTIEGNVDFNTIGEYKIKVIAQDEYGNATEKESTVIITATETSNTSENRETNTYGNNTSASSGNETTTSSESSSSGSSSNSNLGSNSSESSTNTGTSDNGSSSSTAPPSQPTQPECQHEYSNVGSTGILTDEYPGDLAEAIYSSVPGDELFEKYIRPILEKNSGNYAVDVYPVRCEKCKQSLKYTINVY